MSLGRIGRLKPQPPDPDVTYEEMSVHVPHGEAPNPNELARLFARGWEVAHISRVGWAGAQSGHDVWLRRPVPSLPPPPPRRTRRIDTA
jgi:hypothetical protein